MSDYLWVGRLEDSNYIASLGTADLCIYILVFATCNGFNGGMDTLCSQAIGSKNYYLAGLYFNASRIVLYTLFIIQAIILWNIEPVLIGIGMPEVTSAIAAKYIRIVMPGIFLKTMVEQYRRYLSTQGVYAIIVYIQSFTLVTHNITIYVLVYYFELGFYGIAIAVDLTFAFTYLLIVGYMSWDTSLITKESYHYINRDSFNGIKEYLKYGFPSFVMLCLEIWAFDFLMLFSGYLGVLEQSVCAIIINTIAFFFMIPLGMSFTATYYVGSALGSNDPKAAKKYSNVATIMAIVTVLFIDTLLLIFRDSVGRIFTSHEEVIDMISEIVPVLVIFVLFDFSQCVACGIIRAMGYQKLGSYFGLISYWIIALPLSYLFAFTLGYGEKGIWMGFPLGLLAINILNFAIVYGVNFEELANKIVDRIHKEKQQVEQD